MSATSLAPIASQAYHPTFGAPATRSEQEGCDECLGSGGWYRYEPALEPSPGMLYLSCVHCRGTGQPLLPQA